MMPAMPRSCSKPQLIPRDRVSELSAADLIEVFSVGRATVYRTLNRAAASTPGPPVTGKSGLLASTFP
jgi:hypothetical protein